MASICDNISAFVAMEETFSNISKEVVEVDQSYWAVKKLHMNIKSAIKKLGKISTANWSVAFVCQYDNKMAALKSLDEQFHTSNTQKIYYDSFIESVKTIKTIVNNGGFPEFEDVILALDTSKTILDNIKQYQKYTNVQCVNIIAQDLRILLALRMPAKQQ